VSLAQVLVQPLGDLADALPQTFPVLEFWSLLGALHSNAGRLHWVNPALMVNVRDTASLREFRRPVRETHRSRPQIVPAACLTRAGAARKGPTGADWSRADTMVKPNRYGCSPGNGYCGCVSAPQLCRRRRHAGGNREHGH